MSSPVVKPLPVVDVANRCIPILPNFLIIGAAKAGTTAMWHYLRQHPEIFMSRQKEPRFFALYGKPVNFKGPGDQTRFKFVKELQEYQQLFAGVQNEKAIGEASPWYFYVESAAPAIKKMLPDVKLVVLLRDPVERAFSNYLHAVNEGLEPEPTFREAMEAEEIRIRENWSPRFHYKSKGFYFNQLQHYLKFFDRDQLKVYLYEDLTNDPDAMFCDLFKFLGVDPTFRVDVRLRHNESRVAKSKTVERFLRPPNAVVQSLKPLLPKCLRESVKGKMAILKNLNLKPKPKLSRKDREEFIELYRKDIAQLEEFIGRDLSKWIS